MTLMGFLVQILTGFAFGIGFGLAYRLLGMWF